MLASASIFNSLAGIAVDVISLFMALLSSRGISTPSLQARGEQRRFFYFNNDRDIPVFAGFLVNEHPQTAAFIVSKISPACAAKVIGQLPRELRNEIMRRMLSIGPVTEAAVRIIQGQLQEDLLSNVSRHVGSDQNARMADIINKLDRNHMEDVMQSLAAARRRCFT